MGTDYRAHLWPSLLKNATKIPLDVHQEGDRTQLLDLWFTAIAKRAKFDPRSVATNPGHPQPILMRGPGECGHLALASLVGTLSSSVLVFFLLFSS
jgi:hypothetical protein